MVVGRLAGAALLAAVLGAGAVRGGDTDDLPELDVSNHTASHVRGHGDFPVPYWDHTPSPFFHHPTTVIAAGPPRSGSTWQYALLHLIASIFDVPQFADSFPLLDSHRDSFLAQDFTKTSLLMKSHAYSNLYRNRANYVFTSHRDLRDVLSSMITKNFFNCGLDDSNLYAKCRQKLRNYKRHHNLWERHSDYDMDYVEMLNDKQKVIEESLAVLEIHLDQDRLNTVVDRVKEIFETPHSLTNYSDPFWFVGTNHRSDHDEPGYFKSFLKRDVINCVNYEHGKWLKSKEYPDVHVPKKPPKGCTLPQHHGPRLL